MNRKLLEHINKLKHRIACYVTTVYKVSLLSLHFVFIGYFHIFEMQYRINRAPIWN